jgi:fluoride exporter
VTFVLLLAVGGALGAVARYSVANWVYRRMGTGFPWGTLVVNVVGCFLLGVVMTGFAESPLHVQVGALVAVGFLGDFTTFSTFTYETVMLVRDRQWTRALAYQLGSVVLGVLAVVAGMLLGAQSAT